MVGKLKSLALAAIACAALVGAWPSSGLFPNQVQPVPGNFYWAAAGSDAANCLTPVTACQTVAHFNAFSFPGSPVPIVHFHGGDTFSGSLTNFITGMTITSYGAGQPTFTSGNSAACATATNVAGVTINNIICTGGGNLTNTTDGVRWVNSTGNQIVGFTISNSTISAYGHSCLTVVGTNNVGFNTVNVSNNTFHDCTGNFVLASGQNSSCGIVGLEGASGAANRNSNTNVTMSGNVAFNCNGKSGQTAGCPGSGLNVQYSSNVTITSNVTHDNGANNDFGGCGPVGIQAFITSRSTVMFNEAYNQKSGSNIDGEGIDISSSNDLVVAYNYAHNNLNSDFLLGDFSGPNRSVVFVFNIAEQGSASEQAIHFSCGTALGCSTIGIFNNIFINEGITGSHISASWNISNNIFAQQGGAVLFNVGQSGDAAPIITGNDYFSSTSSYSFTVNGTTYTSLAAFQTAGFEKVSGNPVGTTANPNFANLTNPGSGGNCNGVGLNTTCPSAYKITTASPAGGGHGLNITSLYPPCNVGTQDFYSNVETASTLPIGVHFGPGATGGGVPGSPGCPLPYAGIGDVVSGAAVYLGLRPYSLATAGNKAVNVSRASDSHTCDILSSTGTSISTNTGLGLTANCSTGGDNNQLGSSFCSGTTCSITKLYDQTGNGNDNAQSTAANQPTVVFNCLSTLPCMSFNGSTQFLAASSACSVSAVPFTVGLMSDRTGAFSTGFPLPYVPCQSASNSQGIGYFNAPGTVYCNLSNGGTALSENAATDSAFHSLTCAVPNPSSGTTNFVIDSTNHTGTIGGTFATGQPQSVGANVNAGTGSNFFTGEAIEMFVYSSNLTVTQSQNICHQQNLMFGVPAC